MDITTLFKACVKTIQSTNRALGLQNQKSNILKPSKKDVNLGKAKEIIKQVTQLNSFLNEHKSAYLNVLNYLSTNKTMSEVDREQIDSSAERIVNSCWNLIKDYRKEIVTCNTSEQLQEHYRNIVDSLERYLKGVSRIYTETKAIRVKRVIETRKVSKLETIRPKDSEFKPVTVENNVIPVEEISAEEMQMFETENAMLFNELNATSEEVKQMESKVVHIAELQEMFTDKVLQQEQEIERISHNVVGATSNMRDANEQIRQAIQRNAGLRVWVLFFLLVMSFSLLFLDWYND